MLVLSREQVEAHIRKISQMGSDALQAFRQTLSLSNADSKAKAFLYRACDERAKELDRSAAMVVRSDADDFSVGS